MPLLEQNVAGSVDAANTSAWRLTAQTPLVAFHAIGCLSRSSAKTPCGSPEYVAGSSNASVRATWSPGILRGRSRRSGRLSGVACTDDVGHRDAVVLREAA